METKKREPRESTIAFPVAFVGLAGLGGWLLTEVVG